MVEGFYEVTSETFGFKAVWAQGEPKELNWENESKKQQLVSA